MKVLIGFTRIARWQHSRSCFRPYVLSCSLWLTPVLALSISPRVAAAQDVKSIKPGMTADEVKASWGDPLTTRTRGEYSYMYFQNGCLKTCGTYDVVILEKGQVVDAIVRASYHHYEGTSSSPADRKPEPTKP